MAVCALWPLAACYGDFQSLFWYGDEWDQLDQIAKQGYWHWILSPFGENFAPFFKITWGTATLLGGGSYLTVTAVVFAAHYLCVALFGAWMLNHGFGRAATAFAMIVVALASCNFETLGWSIQLISVQGMLFFFAAANWHASKLPKKEARFAAQAVYALLILGGTFSFVRGPLTGVALAALTVYLAWSKAPSWEWNRALHVIGISLAAALLAGVITTAWAPGNHQQLTPDAGKSAATFAGWYLLVNPFHRILDVWYAGPRTYLALGALKVFLVVQGWRWATPDQRKVLVPVFIFELGNAVLLGLGRHHTVTHGDWAAATTTSRYQYIALLTTLPFVAVCFQASLGALTHWPRIRLGIATVLLFATAAFVARDWATTMKIWSEDRGRRTRHLLLAEDQPLIEGTAPGVDFISARRARELIQRFGLH